MEQCNVDEARWLGGEPEYCADCDIRISVGTGAFRVRCFAEDWICGACHEERLERWRDEQCGQVGDHGEFDELQHIWLR